MRHLVFSILAPLGSWGSPNLSSATTAVKPTETAPTRSALVGLLGAAIGMPRRGLTGLAAAIRLAWRADAVPLPQPAADFQTTTKAVPPAAGRTRWTRFEEVRAAAAKGAEGSIISRREYFADGLWTVAVTVAAPGDDGVLERLCCGLTRPVYPLHVGRRCFSLGLPPDPEILDGDTLVAALTAYRLPWIRHPALAGWFEPLAEGVKRRPMRALAWDDGYPGAPVAQRRVERLDMPAFVEHPDGMIVRAFTARPELQATVAWE